MDQSITATEAARRFSELLNTVRFQGMRYTITRGGKAVAALTPVQTRPSRMCTVADLQAVLERLPRMEEADATAFEADLRWIANHQPKMDQPPAWE